MAFVLILLAIGLGFAAWRADEKYIRNFLIACCIANMFGAIHMIATDFDGAYRLQPQSGPEPGDQFEESRPDTRR